MTRPKPMPAPEPETPVYYAKYDYDAANPDELSIRTGDVLMMVKPDEGDGWCCCRIKSSGVEGMIPVIYLSETNDAAPAEAAEQPAAEPEAAPAPEPEPEPVPAPAPAPAPKPSPVAPKPVLPAPKPQAAKPLPAKPATPTPTSTGAPAKPKFAIPMPAKPMPKPPPEPKHLADVPLPSEAPSLRRQHTPPPEAAVEEAPVVEPIKTPSDAALPKLPFPPGTLLMVDAEGRPVPLTIGADGSIRVPLVHSVIATPIVHAAAPAAHVAPAPAPKPAAPSPAPAPKPAPAPVAPSPAPAPSPAKAPAPSPRPSPSPAAPAAAAERYIPYDQLVETKDGIDLTRKETYLEPEEFKTIFGMDREAFYKLPVWRQKGIKNEKRLF
ncbi:hypothetical protein PAPYR_164 [Paratrimastix pyriformis]|uniref:Uncharacterized protein n=1 Tax=Paratrimastix pyriformis TaxID=342808 RepID=A0ABQ8UV14_9EUKA|nr:hypothetical protein PAPYR_164 [Paratrimastix pyriformis]